MIKTGEILKRNLILIFSIPYLVETTVKSIYNPLYTIYGTFWVLLCIIVLEWWLQSFIEIIPKKPKKIVVILLTSFLCSFLYYHYYRKAFDGFFPESFYSITGFFLISILTSYFICNKSEAFLYFRNSSILVMSVLVGLWTVIELKPRSEIVKHLPFVHQNSQHSKESVILLVTDEFHSPDELFKTSHDPRIPKFVSRLKSKGWVLKNTFQTKELSSIHSITSMLDYNLSYDSTFSKTNILDLFPKYLIHSELIQDIQITGSKFINLSIFDIVETKPLTRLYLYPKNFVELMATNSYYFEVFRDVIMEKLLYETPAIQYHNQFIYNHLKDTANSLSYIPTLIYSHLLVQHRPYYYVNRISANDTLFHSYVEFWNKSANKLEILMDELLTANNYKVIVTGSHGYKHLPNKLDPHNTFSAFYGFDSSELVGINSVQDLGILIHGSLCK